MKKNLPRIKKSLKSFILDEDAKVVDKTISKIATYSIFILANIAYVNACKIWETHNNHYNHYNFLNAPLSNSTNIHAGTNADSIMVSNISEKTVETYHANHANRVDECDFDWKKVACPICDFDTNNPVELNSMNKVIPDENLEPLGKPE